METLREGLLADEVVIEEESTAMNEQKGFQPIEIVLDEFNDELFGQEIWQRSLLLILSIFTLVSRA